jgi:hypothetical protein
VSSFLKNTLSNYFEVESPDDQVYLQTNKSIKQSKNKKENKKLLDYYVQQEMDIRDCFFSKTFKQPTRSKRIAPGSILQRIFKWSRHLESKQTMKNQPKLKKKLGRNLLLSFKRIN